MSNNSIKHLESGEIIEKNENTDEAYSYSNNTHHIFNQSIPVKTQLNFIEKEVEYINNEIYNNKKQTSIGRAEMMDLENRLTKDLKELCCKFINDLGRVTDNLKESKKNYENESKITNEDVRLLLEENQKTKLIMLENIKKIDEIERDIGVSRIYSNNK